MVFVFFRLIVFWIKLEKPLELYTRLSTPSLTSLQFRHVKGNLSLNGIKCKSYIRIPEQDSSKKQSSELVARCTFNALFLYYSSKSYLGMFTYFTFLFFALILPFTFASFSQLHPILDWSKA